MNNDALFFALDTDTGKVLWKKDVGELNASSPVYNKGILYAVNLDPGPRLRAATPATARPSGASRCPAAPSPRPRSTRAR